MGQVVGSPGISTLTLGTRQGATTWGDTTLCGSSAAASSVGLARGCARGETEALHIFGNKGSPGSGGGGVATLAA